MESFDQVFLTKSEKEFIKKIKSGYSPSPQDQEKFWELYSTYGFISTQQVGIKGDKILSADMLTQRYEKYCIYRRRYLLSQFAIPILTSTVTTLIVTALQWLL